MTDEEIAALQADLAAAKAQVTTLTEEAATAKAKPPVDAETKRALATAQREAKALKAANEALVAEKATLETRLGETTTRSALRDAGINDADDQEYALLKYGRLAVEDGEDKPDLAEFLANAKTAKEAWIAKLVASPAAPAKPKPVAKVEPKVAEPAADDVEPEPVAPAKPAAPAAPAKPAAVAPVKPSPDAAAAQTIVSTQGTAGRISAADIAAMSPSQYKAHRAKIFSDGGFAAPTTTL